MTSYLAAWLAFMAIPLGALPLVMAADGLGFVGWLLLPILRLMIVLLPVGALLAIPVLLNTAMLFRRAGVANPLPGWWMAPAPFITRAVVILVLLSLLALWFARMPRRARPAAALIGLSLHVGLLSLAATDWVLSLQPGLASSAIGLLLIASQVGSAACLAAVLAAADRRVTGGSALAWLLGAWAFLHFIQYLVVWSANLPAELAWYQARTGAVVWLALPATLVGLVLLPSALARRPAVLGSVAGLLLLMHWGEDFWLVTPAFRGSFTLTLPDVLAMLGCAGVVVGLLLLLRREVPRAVA
jgi:hypothetical protein